MDTLWSWVPQGVHMRRKKRVVSCGTEGTRLRFQGPNHQNQGPVVGCQEWHHVAARRPHSRVSAWTGCLCPWKVAATKTPAWDN